MCLQVEVGAVGDAHELAPLAALEAEAVLDVDGALRVVAELLLGVLIEPQVLGVDAEVGVPAQRLVDPVLVPLFVSTGLDEELHLHLLELASAEDEVSGRDLVAEALAHLTDAEGRLHAARTEHVGEVHEDALSGLGPQVVQSLLVVDRAEVGLQQAGEVLRLRPGAGLAGVGVLDVGEAVDRRMPVLLLVRLEQVIGAIALVGVQRLDERVGEDLDVP